MRLICGHMWLHCFLNGHGNHDDYDLLKNSWLKRIQLNYEICRVRLCIQAIKRKKEQKVTEFTSAQAYESVSKHTRMFPHIWLDLERIRKFKLYRQTVFACELSDEIARGCVGAELEAKLWDGPTNSAQSLCTRGRPGPQLPPPGCLPSLTWARGLGAVGEGSEGHRDSGCLLVVIETMTVFAWCSETNFF